MAADDFRERLERIEAARLAAEIDQRPARPGAKGASIAARSIGTGVVFLIYLLCVPLGIITRVLTQIYMEIDTTAVHFWPLLIFVVVAHLVLIVGGILAALTFARKPIRLHVMAAFWAGYGVGVALLTLQN